MKRLILAFALLLPATTEAATLAQIKTAIKNFRDAHAAKIVAKQNAYLAAHGTYWQGIVTPSEIPDDGATVVQDYTRRPTDHVHRWIDVFAGVDALPDNIPAQIQVDVYGGPLGQGWTLTVRATKNGNLYWKTWAVGPETWREQDWQSCTLPCGLP